ncbi:MAG: SRPBCC domain-containing protein [Actinomycetota bacterium]|nr:SRPBCC domain-containing protein [Actinomycetota bacterium]
MTQTTHDVSPVVQTIEIDAPAERVFELWTRPEELVRWWPDAAELEPRVGGRLKLEFEGRGEVWGELTRFEPPNGLGFTWIRGIAPEVTTYVDVTIEDLGNGRSRVELVHSGFENVPQDQVAEWRAMHDAGWIHFLGCLADLAAGRHVDKQFVPPTTD